MDKPEEPFVKTFNIYQRHLNLLNDVNENSSIALRTILDSIIRNDKRQQTKQILNNTLLYVSLGMLFLLISYLMIPLVQLVCILIGVFLVGYGSIGGLMDGLQITRKRKTGI